MLGIILFVKARQKLILDVVYTIGAALLINGVLQLLIYPIINSKLGDEEFGNIIFYISIINIIGQAVGMSLSNNRLAIRRTYEVSNGDSNLFLLIFIPIGTIIGTVIIARYINGFGVPAYSIIIIFSILRFYASVQYRLILNYKKFLLYNAILAIGYLVGTVAFVITKTWYWIFIAGEVGVTVYMLIRGSIFTNEPKTEHTKLFMKSTTMLMISMLLYEGVTNADKIILLNIIDSHSVSVYYVATLIGKTMIMFVGPINNVTLSYLSADKNKMTADTFMKISFIFIGVGVMFYIICLFGTPIYAKLFYHNMYNEVVELNAIVSFSQIVNFISSLLAMLILATFGSKYYFNIQFTYALAFIPITIAMSANYGIWGMSYGSLMANIIRLVLTMLIGKRKFKRHEVSDH